MAQMDYFRRPALAGKNLTRLLNGRVRGSLRRSDPDGFSSTPYFPGASGGTVNITTDAGGAVIATLTSNDFTQILADINTALGVNGTAFSDDGSIAMQTTTAGSGGFIKVTGGTSAVAIGFETYGGVLPIEGRGADVDGSPEGRIGNLFGTTFPNRGENLTRDVMVRSMGRLASNSDVLWSDHAKNSISTKIVTSVVGTGGLFITPTASQRMFVGGELNAASTKKTLASYYQLIDTVTGLPAASQIAAVVRGTPVGDPPYANSPSWTDTTGKNILGLDQTKATQAITKITGGRIIECTGATFQTAGVVAGDFAEITGATNLSPWNNNGYKWIVEAVLSQTALSLRPMSFSDLATVGTTVPDVQPLVELNETKTGLEIYGNVVVKTGPFAHNTTFVVRPPIPPGATYDLWSSVPQGLREDKAPDKQLGAAAALKDVANDLDPTDNWIVFGLDPTLAGPNCNVASGYVRLHGTAYFMPARVFVPGDFVNGTNYIYWSESTNNLVVTTNVADFGSVLADSYLSPTNKGHPVARVVVTAGVISSVNRMVRRRMEKAISITVGDSGQFKKLEDAVRYANAISTASGETTSNSGAYPHYEFIITNSLTLSEDITFSMPGVTIRGVDQRVSLNTGGQRLHTSGTMSEFAMEDLLHSGSSAALLQVENTLFRAKFKNVRSIGTYANLIKGIGGTLNELIIDDCTFLIDTCVARVDGTSTVRFTNSIFFSNSVGSSPCALREDSVATWAGAYLLMEGCLFQNVWLGTTSTDPLIVGASSSTSQVVIRDCLIDCDLSSSAANSHLFSFAGRALVKNVRNFVGQVPRPIVGSAETIVEDCSFLVNPEGSNAAITANVVRNTTLIHQDTDASTSGGVGLKPFSEGARFEGNTISGPFFAAIYGALSEGLAATGNFVTLSFTANAQPFSGILVAGARNVVSDNTIVVTDGAHTTQSIVATSDFDSTISNNTIRLRNLTAASIQSYGIRINSSFNTTVTGNSITNFGARTSAAGQEMQGIDMAQASNCSVTGNTINLEASGNAVWVGIHMGLATQFCFNCTINHNVLSIYGYQLRCFATNLTNVIDGNTCISTTANAFDGVSGRLAGVVTNNRFSFTAGTFNLNQLGAGTFTGNIFDRVEFVFGGGEATTPIIFSDNIVEGTFTLSTASSTSVIMNGNHIVGTMTISTASGVYRIDGTRVIGAASITCAAMEMSSSRFEGAFTLVSSGNGNISSSILGTTTSSITISGGFLTACYFGTATFALGSGTVSASNLGGGSLASGHIVGCRIGTSDFNLGVNSSTYAFTDLSFSNNGMLGGILFINPYVGTIFETQRVSVTGNYFRPNVITPSGPISGLVVQRGRGVVISGNTIHGPGIPIDAGTVANVSDLIISSNYMLGQLGDYSLPTETLSIASNGSGVLANGTYLYLGIFIYSVGGATANRVIYSKTASGNAVVLSAGPPNNGITVTCSPFVIGPAPSGLTFIASQIWRTADAGVTWRELTASAFDSFGVFVDSGGDAGVVGTPIATVTTNSTNDRPSVRLIDTTRTRILGNLMAKAVLTDSGNFGSSVGVDPSFIIVGASAKGTLIGDNHFADGTGGLTDDANTSVNEDDTYWTANPTTTYAAAGAVGSGGTRKL